MTSSIYGSGVAATAPDNLPGASRGPVSNYVPEPRGVALGGAPAGTTVVQFAQAARNNAGRQYEAWRSQVPAHLLSQHARDFMATPAYVEYTQAADAVAQRANDAQTAADRVRGGLSTPLDAAAQTRADRWWRSQEPVLEKATTGGIGAALNTLASHAEPWQLSVISEMAGPLLQAKGISPDTLDAILGQHAPELKAANAVAQKAAQAHAVVHQNRLSFEKAVKLGTISSQPVDASPYDSDVAA
jgi:hypothetical protein